MAEPLALTIPLTAKELKAEGAGPVADDGHQSHILYLQGGIKHVDLQATVVHITNKYLGGKRQIGGLGQCRQSSFLGWSLPHFHFGQGDRCA